MGSGEHRFGLAQFFSHGYGVQEEEASQGAKSLVELERSLGPTQGSEMPLEELLALYGYEVSEPIVESNRQPSEPATSLPDMTLDKGRRKTRLSRQLMTLHPPSHHMPLISSSAISVDEEKDSSECASEDSVSSSVQSNDGGKDIMVGPQFQASIPPLSTDAHQERAYENEDQLLWTPGMLTGEAVEEFLLQAQKRGGEVGVAKAPTPGDIIKDNEQALYELVKCNFNAEEALRRLRFNIKVFSEELCAWSEEECRNFEHGYRVHGKNFHLIQANKVRTRSVGECVEYYYAWKKSDRHEYFTQQTTKLGRKKYSLQSGTMEDGDPDGEGGEMEGCSHTHNSPCGPLSTSQLDPPSPPDVFNSDKQGAELVRHASPIAPREPLFNQLPSLPTQDEEPQEPITDFPNGASSPGPFSGPQAQFLPSQAPCSGPPGPEVLGPGFYQLQLGPLLADSVLGGPECGAPQRLQVGFSLPSGAPPTPAVSPAVSVTSEFGALSSFLRPPTLRPSPVQHSHPLTQYNQENSKEQAMVLENSSRACLLALIFGVCTCGESGLSPRGLECVFMEYANVTCQWEPGVDTPPDTQYILQTQCSVPMDTLNDHYCIRVIAKRSHAEASSAPLCLDAIQAGKLYAPVFSRLSAIPGKPHCLEVQWSRPEIFPLSREHPQPQILDVDLRQTEQCFFCPFTLYNMSIRFRYHSALSHWSDWSSQLQARTEEAGKKKREGETPSAAPQLWRLIEGAGVMNWRRVTLVWKSLPKSQANGRVLEYSVSCWQEGHQNPLDQGGCETLSQNERFCQLSLPPQRCFCSLSASNSVGTSPPAVITISSTLDRESRDPIAFNISALDEYSLEVSWGDPVGPSAKGVWPEVCYTVSVRVEYGMEAGPEQTLLAYSRQGAPSAGPRLHVTELGSSSMSLQWDPVPLEQRHGFIRNYTLFYENDHNTTWVVLAGEVLQYQLNGLSGVYRIYMVANTDAGQGAAGPPVTVVVEGHRDPALTIIRCSFLPFFTLLILFYCLRWRQRVPDPAQSSLSFWIPATMQRVEKKDSKDAHGQSPSDNGLLSHSNTSLCVLDSAMMSPFPSTENRLFPLFSQYVRHGFEQGRAQPSSPTLSQSSSSHPSLIGKNTQEGADTDVIGFSFNTYL
ncbi:hypothetical protein JZ751_024449 [Albula glossodonta]|uniref:Mesoderm induction early response protein 2 n=1 Tax=Albula glossodonta TaxID=121402 RepID=A0A8T2PEP1_9TELE|nr:hypothetical protein JZ751_024449 [Albula glossodonta]